MSFALDIALGWYLTRGLLIFPCKDKKPLTETGFKAASKDAGQIRHWWTQWPSAQFGLSRIASLSTVPAARYSAKASS